MIIITEAIILKREPFREYDEKVLMFTKKLGKIWTLSFGSRSINSIRGKQLGVINWLEVMLEEKNQKYLLRQINSRKVSEHLNEKGFYLDFSELLKKVSERTPPGAKMDDVYSLLKLLSNEELSIIKSPFRKFTFIFSFIIELGIAPSFSQCFVCKEYCSNEYYFYLPNILIGSICKDKTHLDSFSEFKLTHQSTPIKLSRADKIGLVEAYALSYYVRNYQRTLVFHKKINQLIANILRSKKKLTLDWESIDRVMNHILRSS